MGGLLNRNAFPSRTGPFAPIPTTPEGTCLEGILRPWKTPPGTLFSAGQLEIRSPRTRPNAGSVESRRDLDLLARLNATAPIISPGQDKRHVVQV